MSRYFRLYAHFLRFSFMRAMEFKVDFYFRILMDTIFYIINICFYKIIFDHTNVLGDWNEAQMMVFVASYLCVDAIMMTVFANNLWWIPVHINKGSLDYYLIRPVSSLFFMGLQDFAASSFVNLLISFGFLGWAISGLPEIYWSRIPLFLLFILNGSFLYSLMQMYFQIPVFWTQSQRGYNDLYWSLCKFMEKPDHIYTGWARKILTTILPFALMASYPARIYIDGFSWEVFGYLTGVTSVMFVILIYLWNWGLKNYSSASS